MNHQVPELVPDAFAAGNAAFADCQLTESFLNEQVRPIVEEAIGPSPTDSNATWLGLLLRNIGWLRSLSKLNHPGDFQAVAVAARTLFEIAVDGSLMHYDPDSPPEKLRAWEDSAKLKSAEAIKQFYVERKLPLPTEHTPLLDFIRREGHRLEHLREQFWHGKHPPRWTGRDLRSDAKKATGWVKRAAFEEFYVTQFPMLCWNTHGSGLAGVRLLNARIFPMVSGEALAQCASFSMIIAEVVLRHFGQLNTERAQMLQDHNDRRTLTRYEAYQDVLEKRGCR